MILLQGFLINAVIVFCLYQIIEKKQKIKEQDNLIIMYLSYFSYCYTFLME